MCLRDMKGCHQPGCRIFHNNIRRGAAHSQNVHPPDLNNAGLQPFSELAKIMLHNKMSKKQTKKTRKRKVYLPN